MQEADCREGRRLPAEMRLALGAAEAARRPPRRPLNGRLPPPPSGRWAGWPPARCGWRWPSLRGAGVAALAVCRGAARRGDARRSAGSRRADAEGRPWRWPPSRRSPRNRHRAAALVALGGRQLQRLQRLGGGDEALGQRRYRQRLAGQPLDVAQVDRARRGCRRRSRRRRRRRARCGRCGGHIARARRAGRS